MQIMLASLQQEPHLAEMLRQYLDELCGDPEYPYLPLYWQHPHERFPDLIVVDAEVVGFSLVRRTDTFEVAEFYVAPPHRRKGCGRSALDAILKKHVGPWCIEVSRSNRRGMDFWSQTLARYGAKLPAMTDGCERVQFRLSTVRRGEGIVVISAQDSLHIR